MSYSDSFDREVHDLNHFVFSCGEMGRLKVLSTTNVIAGDSFELDAVGSFRLSPLRRGLAIDSNVDYFTFYIPYRHTYGQDWVDFMKEGVNSDPLQPMSIYPEIWGSSFLGIHPHSSYQIPRYYWDAYRQIWNNFFKAPWMTDAGTVITDLGEDEMRHGFRCCHLKNIWSAPLPPNTPVNREYGIDSVDSTIEIMGLQSAYANLRTDQERVYFMERYRDVMHSFGGSATIDADNRPQLLMRTNLWASGYDVDGTDQTSLGQFSGRVQQTFHHTVPRFHVPEHGIIMTLVLARFPPTATYENPFFVNRPNLTYSVFAGDPDITQAQAPSALNMGDFFHEGSETMSFKVAFGQWYRYQNSHVDYEYHQLEGFPFIQGSPGGSDLTDHILVNPNDYDQCFQSLQLRHFNIQSKFNPKVYRNYPTTRDTILTK